MLATFWAAYEIVSLPQIQGLTNLLNHPDVIPASNSSITCKLDCTWKAVHLRFDVIPEIRNSNNESEDEIEKEDQEYSEYTKTDPIKRYHIY